MRIKLVLFDAFDTIVTPRLPVHVQYASVFAPYFTLDPAKIKPSFKKALKQVQTEFPAYTGRSEGFQRPSDGWWGEVIKRTVIGAGGDPNVVERSLPEIVPAMVHRFSSREGYKLFDDTIPTFNALRERGIKTGVVSNTDSTMRLVLDDLGVLSMLSPVVLSAEEGVEKPSKEIWERALTQLGLDPSEAVHVGDEVETDYRGAKAAGLRPLLLQRPEKDQLVPEEAKEDIITSLTEVVDLVDKWNGRTDSQPSN